jgi:hypothetical protein
MGMTGASGPIGPAGSAASIVVGSTVTGVAGSSANVVNVGSSSNAVLSFTIPTGAPGPQGPIGPSGGVASSVFGEVPGGSIDGANKNYGTLYPFSAGLLAVYLNGLRQRHPDDYSETGSQSFQMLAAPLPGDSISVDYTRA